MTGSVCVCVTGWHFPPATFEKLGGLAEADVYVISHRPEDAIPAAVYDHIPAERILIRPNYGYDWGCFQQFLETGIWRNYDYIVFMHDDVQILRMDFMQAAISLLSDQIILVGNGRNSERSAYHAKEGYWHAHSSWIPPIDFQYDTVRGSFFVMKRSTVAMMEQFEVMWDRRRWHVGFGNWSQRASCAKLHHLFGFPCFAFLSEEYSRSEYLLEDERGGVGRKPPDTWFGRKRFDWYKRLCWKYVVSTQINRRTIYHRALRALRKRIIDSVISRPV